MKTFADYGIDVPANAKLEHRTTCPDCSPTSNHPQDKCLGANTELMMWGCFKCGYSGSLYTTEQTDQERQSIASAKKSSRAKIVTAMAKSDVENGLTHSPEDQATINQAKKQMEKENLTDVGNGNRLVNQHGHNLRYVTAVKKWIAWEGNRWCFDASDKIWLYAKQTAINILDEAINESDENSRRELIKHAAKSQSEFSLRAMISLSRSELPISLQDLDTNNYLLGVKNGVINLQTGELTHPKRNDFITKQTHVKYDSAKDCLAWKGFLLDIMAGNHELINFLQRAVGYSLSGDTSEQCLFFCYGTGANGKSTFLNAVKDALGGYAMQTPATTFMTKKDNANSNDLASLKGARFVAANELEDGQRFAESTIKQLTGGDIVACRFLFGEFFEYKPQAKIWIAGNHVPIIRGDDYGIWRRIKLIPFTFTIPDDKKDKDLPDMLRAEYPGILNWCLEGFKQWQVQGLNPPKEVMEATQEYRGDMDVLQQWIDESCAIDPRAITTAKRLYGSYFEWAKEQYGHAMSQRNFGIKMVTKGFRKEKVQIVQYYGIKLNGDN